MEPVPVCGRIIVKIGMLLSTQLLDIAAEINH